MERIKEILKELGEILAKHQKEGLTRKESNEGLRMARTIVGIIASRGTSPETLQIDVVFVTEALTVKAIVAEMDGCHRDAHSCPNFRQCYIRCHVISPEEIPKEITAEVLRGRYCYEGIECSLNLDMPGRRGASLNDISHAVVGYGD